jgi:hypothetical protein
VAITTTTGTATPVTLLVSTATSVSLLANTTTSLFQAASATITGSGHTAVIIGRTSSTANGFV